MKGGGVQVSEMTRGDGAVSDVIWGAVDGAVRETKRRCDAR